MIAVFDISLVSRLCFNKGEWTSDHGMGWDYASTVLSIRAVFERRCADEAMKLSIRAQDLSHEDDWKLL